MNLDPYVHVERNSVQGGADYRNVIVQLLAKATDAPSIVTTGCGIQVPYASTSRHPERVTCLPCREHASRGHFRFADDVENLGRVPSGPVTSDQAVKVAEWARERARRFGSE